MGQENLVVLRSRIKCQDWSILSNILTDITIILFFNIYSKCVKTLISAYNAKKLTQTVLIGSINFFLILIKHLQ